jgi:hypothetical protein
MPTILELFKGSNKDISPKIPNQFPVQDKFRGSSQEKAVKANTETLIEEEVKGIRIRSAVELNNPLLYGNQAIRIATRSTSAVELMKSGTGGSAGDGGLIGKGLGAITGGKFGKFIFGGKVTSLNQARDGINTRLGIPSLLIPTYVKNTGELQKGLEPDTMITLSKIQNDGKGTLLGRFLKQSGGGTPQTIGKQILGQGITLGKNKLRSYLFGDQTSLGANNTKANGSYEYSSTYPYSKQISDAKFGDKKIDVLAEKARTDITKKITQLQLDAKEKLGKAASNATNALKKNLTGKESKPEIDKVVASQTKETSATANTYEEKYNKLVERDSVETNLQLPDIGNITELKKDVKDKEESKKPLGLPEGFTKPKLKGTESKAEIDNVTQSQTKETTNTPKTYTETLGDYKNEDVTTRIDLSLVSPIKGIDRRKTKGRFGTTEYALFDPKNTTGKFSPNDPTRPYTGVAGNAKTPTLENKYGLSSRKDQLNNIVVGNSTDKLGDFIPLQIGSVNDGGKVVHFRTLITGFTETISPSWDSSKFVGNPYPFWTYSGVERSASFTLRMYCMSADELALMWEKISWLSSKVYPKIVDKMIEAPFIQMTIGSIYKQRVGFINSLSYTIADDITWETTIEDFYLPKVVDVQIEFKLVESAGVETKSLYNYEMSADAVKGINNKRAEQKGNVVGTDPITQPQVAGDSNFKQVQTKKPTQPPKVDSTGVEQTQAPPAQTSTSTPKSLDTGKPTDTPQGDSKPASTTESAKVVESSYMVVREKALKKYKGIGYPDWLAQRFASYEGAKRTISNITKLEEEAYYAEVSKSDGDIVERVFLLENNLSSYVEYAKWVSDNGGKDPMNKFFSKDQMDTIQSSGKLQTSSPF